MSLHLTTTLSSTGAINFLDTIVKQANDVVASIDKEFRDKYKDMPFETLEDLIRTEEDTEVTTRLVMIASQKGITQLIEDVKLHDPELAILTSLISSAKVSFTEEGIEFKLDHDLFKSAYGQYLILLIKCYQTIHRYLR